MLLYCSRKINAGQKKMVLLRTSEDGKVTLHPKSVNTVQTTDFESHFLVYHEKLLSSCIFIYDTTMISALPLLVFCYDFYLTYTKKKAIIELNKDLRFVCSKKTAYYITVNTQSWKSVLPGSENTTVAKVIRLLIH